MLTLQISSQFDSAARQGGAGWYRAPGRCRVEIVTLSRRPAGPRPVTLATGLDRTVCDGVAVRSPSLAAAEANRGFSVGTFYLPGQIVDRSA